MATSGHAPPNVDTTLNEKRPLCLRTLSPDA